MPAHVAATSGNQASGHVAGLVNHHQQRPVETDARDVSLVGLILEITEQSTKDRRESLLIIERRHQVQRVGLLGICEPVQIDEALLRLIIESG